MNNVDQVQQEPMRHKLHPSHILISWIGYLKGLLPFFIIVWFDYQKDPNLSWFHAIPVVLLILFFIMGFLSWQRFYYVLERDRIRIFKGILFREERNLYYVRMHSVNMEQPLLHRLLGVAQIKIEMPGGKSEGDGVLYAIALDKAKELEQWIRQQSAWFKQKKQGEERSTVSGSLNDNQELSLSSIETVEEHVQVNLIQSNNKTTLKLPLIDILLASVTTLNISLVLTFIFGAISFADDILPASVYDQVLLFAQTLLPTWWGIALVGVIAAWVLSSLLFVLKYGGFLLEHDGEQLSISYGLIEKKKHVFAINRVQAVVVKEGIVRQLLGYAEVGLHIVSSNKNETVILHPFIRTKLLENWLAEMVPQFVWMKRERTAPRRALYAYFVWDIVFTSVLVIAAVWYFGISGLWSLMLFVIWLPISYMSYSDAGFTCRGEQLTIWKRDVARFTVLARRPQMVSFQKQHTIIQQKIGLQRMKVMLMGDVGGSTFYTGCLEQHDVEEVWKWFSRSRRAASNH